MKKFDIFYTRTLNLLKLYGLGILILLIFRLITLFTFGSLGELINYKSELASSFIIGFRIDTMVMMYGLALPLLIILLTPIFELLKIKTKNIDRVIRIISTIIFSLFIFLSIADFYFFQQYKSHFNILVFALINDDTTAILKSVWIDYPIILITILLSITVTLLWKSITYFFKKDYVFLKSGFSKSIYTTAFILLFALGIRGSVGLFPLGEKDLFISDNIFINNLADNAIFSLKTAAKNKKTNYFNDNISTSLKRYGYTDASTAVNDYLGTDNNLPANVKLMTTTRKNEFLENNKPNVVFVLMESLGSFYFDLHSEDLNLLGSLESELKNMIMFRNFLPKGPRTIHSLEGLVFNNMQNAPISQTEYYVKSFSSANAKPFFDKGYHTLFASGAKLGWRNIGQFYSNQYFNHVSGNTAISKQYKNVESDQWGVYDEYLYQYLFDELEKTNHNKKPIFAFGLTTTNHSPYDLPSKYKPYSLKLNDSIKGKLIRSQKLALGNFGANQYANDQLGKFIQRVRQSKYGENTIIIATGDHTNTELFNFSDAELFHQYSVPLLMYIPEKYKQNLNINNKTFGSHKDIFPTIFNLALSDAQYLNTGNNMLDSVNDSNFGITMSKYIFNKDGAVILGRNKLYYNWTDNNNLKKADTKTIPSLNKLAKKANAFEASMRYNILNEIKKK
ncbi:MAG: sulfatase-like hydrolase/transferase [Ichthyobacteriaceae bacterium]|nr:sulfatase-like hydrolase/transferase [Ichthyobacteriaceae bacterium]